MTDSGLIGLRVQRGGSLEGYHESRRCSRNTFPESYITKCTSIRRLSRPRPKGRAIERMCKRNVQRGERVGGRERARRSGPESSQDQNLAMTFVSNNSNPSSISTEQFPVSTYVGSSKNLKDLKLLPSRPAAVGCAGSR